MSNYPNLAAEAGDKYLAMLAQRQDQFIEFVRSSREMMPRMPHSFPTMAPGFPSPKEIADAQFTFATKLLKQQESFLRNMYKLSDSKPASKRASASTESGSGTKSRSTTRRTTRKSTKASS